jgi:antitoxin (DNA-binding transcriptional repressor) of toxin-antitoxin stability system
MKFISARELRNRPGFIRELVQKEDMVLTADGKPVAILLGIEGDGLEEAMLIIRQARTQRALSRMRRQAARRGIADASPRAIEAEIRAVRRKRKSRNGRRAGDR